MRRLLAPDVLANFDKAIRARLAAGQTMTTTLVSIDAADFVEARLAGSIATVAVRFAAKLASATRDASGAVVEGSASDVADHLDIWTFTPRRRLARSQLAARGDANGSLSGRRRREGDSRARGALLGGTAMAPRLEPVRFDDLAGFESDDGLAAFAAFAPLGARALRRARRRRAPPALRRRVSSRSRARPLDAEIRDAADARRFFAARFQAFRVDPDEADGGLPHRILRTARQGFADADGRIHRADPGAARAISSPFAPAPRRPASIPRSTGARRLADGTLRPYPDRADDRGRGRAEPLLWLADPVEVFLVQVQGSARVALPDGREVRLAYDGRNGQPYTSIGRLLIEAGEIAGARDVARRG